MSSTLRLKIAAAASLLAVMALQGCATLTGSDQQEVAVHAILDHREVSGVGCVLSNPAGRWFVTAPGLVTIRKSKDPLAIDCKKDGVGAAREVVASQFGIGKLIGNAVVSAGLGYFVDRRSGAGFDYPATLTVMMRPLSAAPTAATEQGASTPVY
ncbi:hypothetical protein [Massilia psychrophila]|uniref:Lipoprotein n=1 Tax=Massilia psychrophila TaxID=1603353 RepID=A0A2G8T5E6_9BURK|nr:hypothetical protein [Massilia psychrophila]PIL41232.1 hypothetical protein CR103_03860 [Massilia psychrophila]GGE67727.1 hypothetical protein GCM10008020_10160 [Massilia psychrophila]